MKRLPVPLARACALSCALSLAGIPVSAQNPAPPPPPPARPAPANDLDAFMEKVLARREVNRKTIDQYVLDESEAFEILGPGRWPLHRTRRDFTWYVRDGMHVRSPVRFNGVKVGDDARDKYETDWMHRERERQERKAKEDQEKAKGDKDKAKGGEISIGRDGIQISTGGPVATEPRFVSEAYFMDFKFEPGNYYLAGREQLEGHDVLKIEYYPTKMFGDSDDDKNKETKAAGKETKEKKEEKKPSAADERRQRREQQMENDIERRMNKTALITLWVDPTEHQIVRYTFDNVWLDFLPAGWLVRDRRHPGVDDDGPAVSGRLAAARPQHPFGHHAGQRVIRGLLRADVRRIPARRGLDQDARAEERGGARAARGPRSGRRAVRGLQTPGIHWWRPGLQTRATPAIRRAKSSAKFEFTATPSCPTRRCPTSPASPSGRRSPTMASRQSRSG